MGFISYRLKIDAPREEVFRLIADVEGFNCFSSAIKEVRRTAPRHYRWKVEILGIPLEWEADVVEFREPALFGWQSTSGVYNRGRYVLTPVGRMSTLVEFELEYRLSNPVIDRLTSLVSGSVVKSIYREILDNIKKELEKSD